MEHRPLGWEQLADCGAMRVVGLRLQAGQRVPEHRNALPLAMIVTQGVLQYSEEPLVSADIVGNPASCIFSARDTMANGRMVKVLGWYDNEWGYSNRLVDLTAFIGGK